MTFDGPTGKGINRKCVGCMPFFDRLGLTKDDFTGLCTYMDGFDKFIRGHMDDGSERDRVSNLLDRLKELCNKLNVATQTPEHYYAAILAIANGSLDFASGGDGEAVTGGRRKKKPRELPLIPPRTKDVPNRPANPCQNPICRAKCTDPFHPIRHGETCNGSRPRWEAILHLDLLTPGPLMQDLSSSCRTVVLASGSLSPIPSLCAELNLFPAEGSLSPVKSSKPNPMNALPKIQRRLQNHPTPLEADHVIDLEKQLCAISIGHFPDGSELRVNQKNYNQQHFLPKLGEALVNIVAGIPKGGVLVFLPSYALLRKCERLWNPDGYRQNRRTFWSQNDDADDGPSVWDRLKELKHNVIVEPSGNQDAFEEKKQEYMDSVTTLGGCVLLAVYRGKMSEGISFNDDYARGVICIGVPLPSSFALPIKTKMVYNDEQRNLRGRTDLLPGREWYSQQAYRAIAQALGRCIRHAGDYGAVFLLDIRHCDDGSPNGGIPQAHKNLPKWMRRSVRNLSKNTSLSRGSMFNYASSSTNDTILGGWPGLKTELQRFFKNAKPHAEGVLKRQKEKMAAASKGRITVVGENITAASIPSQPTTSSSFTSSSTPMQTKVASSSSSKSMDQDREQHSNLSSIKSKPSQQIPKKKESTLEAMFKKQQETEGTAQKRPATSATSSTKSSKAAKRASNAQGTLKNMFEKQRKAASTSTQSKCQTQEMVDLNEDDDDDNDDGSDDAEANDEDNDKDDHFGGDANEMSTNNKPPTKATNTFLFKKSPFSDETLTPTTEVSAGTSHLALQSQTVNSATEDDEHLCVVCEDNKKQVMLMPCKHMCLCRSCTNMCLYKTIKECPMCRAKIEDSIEVFW